MLKIVEDIDELMEGQLGIFPSTLTLDDEFLKTIKKGKKLKLHNFNGGAQFFIEIMNNKKPRKKDVIPVPFQRSIYARGYQCFLTHENGRAKIVFDENNWLTFDIASFVS